MKCVAAAQKNGGSIAFPTVGCGGLKYPVQEVAEAFMKTAEKYSDVDVSGIGDLFHVNHFSS